MDRHGLVGADEVATLTKSASEQQSLFDMLIEEDYLDEMTLIGLISEDCGLTPMNLINSPLILKT